METTKHYLFSYGTLQLKSVQIQIYNRKLKGFKAVLEGYKLEQLEITDIKVLEKSQQKFHPIAIPSKLNNDAIEGIVFEITEQELLQTDAYEVSDYKRVLETFKSGKQAWVYVIND